MRALSGRFDEIHGVDVSSEMIRLARRRLRDVNNAFFHPSNGTDLAGFEDASFDFVYSYAVFQHIPEREIIFRYLEEAVRVLKPGGLLWCHLNGLPETEGEYDTWNGARIGAAEILEFAARRSDFRLLALGGAWTQYMWITGRKGPPQAATSPFAVRRITNCQTAEPVVPSSGRFASMALWVEGLPDGCDLLGLEATIDGEPGSVFYIGPPDFIGLQHINVRLPDGVGTGLRSCHVSWLGEPLAPPFGVRVVPPGPALPKLIEVTDAVDLASGAKIVSGCVRVTIEEVERPEQFAVSIGGEPVLAIQVFCTDPVPPRFDFTFHLPESAGPGPHHLDIRVGRTVFAPVAIEAVRA
jgi:hypothetical protein